MTLCSGAPSTHGRQSQDDGGPHGAKEVEGGHTLLSGFFFLRASMFWNRSDPGLDPAMPSLTHSPTPMGRVVTLPSVSVNIWTMCVTIPWGWAG